SFAGFDSIRASWAQDRSGSGAPPPWNISVFRLRPSVQCDEMSLAGFEQGEEVMKKLQYGFLAFICLLASSAWADSLELKNGSLIKGTYMGGSENQISF